MQKQLAMRSLSDDDPPWLSQFWFGSHPTTLQRIGMARALEQQTPLSEATERGPVAGAAPGPRRSISRWRWALPVSTAHDAAGLARTRS